MNKTNSEYRLDQCHKFKLIEYFVILIQLKIKLKEYSKIELSKS